VDYLEFKARFDQEYSKLKLPEDCTELLNSSVPTSSLVWTFKWYLEFSDGSYIQIKEHYTKKARMIQHSHRAAFNYHYGPVVQRTADGLPEAASANPVHIRIDTSNSPAHMHLGSPNPHYEQARVENLDMQNLDMFTFIKAVLKHRRTGASFQETLNFRIT
jgi:hypothetical protein